MLTRARAPVRLTLPVETPEKALENLLRELLSVEQLRRLLRGLPGGEALVDELPGAPASSAEVLHQAVLELKRAGMVDQELFDALAEERPRKAARIQAVAEVWATATPSPGAAAGPPPAEGPPVAPTARPTPSASPEAPAGEPVRVFISYSQDSPTHKAAVLDLADRLRADGIDAWIDQYVAAPPEGWPRWMSDQVERAQHIVLVCTETYKRRFEGRETPGTGKGATWEGLLATQVLYDAGTINEKLIPVLFDGASDAHIPLALKPYTHYRLPAGYDGLYRHLTGQPAVVAPPLGKVRVVAPPPRGQALPAQPVVSAGLPLASPSGAQTVINHGPVGQQINIQGGSHVFNLVKGDG